LHGILACKGLVDEYRGMGTGGDAVCAGILACGRAGISGEWAVVMGRKEASYLLK